MQLFIVKWSHISYHWISHLDTLLNTLF
jgi:hypothetical protein